MPKKILMKVEKFKELRIKAGQNLADFAKVIGCSKQLIWLIETEKRSPSPKVARKIADYFGLKFDDLFRFEKGVKIEQKGQ